MEVIFHYSEIALKKGNRSFYEQILRQNIANSLKQNCDILAKVSIKQSTGFINGEFNQDINCLFQVLLLTPGIAWFGIEYANLPLSTFKDKKYAQVMYQEIALLLHLYFKKFSKHLHINVVRKNKILKVTSQDIWINLRQLQRKSANVGVGGNVFENNIDKEGQIKKKLLDIIGEHIDRLHSLQIIIDNKAVHIYARFNGVFGLPVGATGKGVVLFSGGIDSPVAAFVAAKRGISFDLLHFSPYSADEIKQTKIYEIYKKLKLINPYARLFVASVPFSKQAKTNQEIIAKLYNPMVVFKRIIAQVACLLGTKLYKNGFIVVSGDSLGQVSSQTISNLIAVNKAFYYTNIKQNIKNDQSDQELCLDRAVFVRPLSGMNKDEIIDIAKQINTYDSSIKEYVDCCSILAKTSKTSTNLGKIQMQDKYLNIEKIIKQAFDTVQKIE